MGNVGAVENQFGEQLDCHGNVHKALYGERVRFSQLDGVTKWPLVQSGQEAWNLNIYTYYVGLETQAKFLVLQIYHTPYVASF